MLNRRQRYPCYRGERVFVLLTHCGWLSHHILASPSKIGGVVQVALVFTHFDHGCLA